MNFIKRWIRQCFCRNEIKKDEMLVLWRDVDGQITGWNVDASDDRSLITVHHLLRAKKRQKLRQITGMCKKKENLLDKLYPITDEDIDTEY